MSIRDISAILKEEESRRQKYEDKQQQEEICSKAYKLLSEGKTSVQVATILKLRDPEVGKLYGGYWKRRGSDKHNIIFKKTNAGTKTK